MTEKWVSTSCFMCYNSCGIKVQVVDGKVLSIKGNPNSPLGKGKVCAKGHAAIMNLYNPYRAKSPLKRSNPEKGPGVDPRWVEITWDEAIDIVASRLKKVREEDPRKLVVGGLDFRSYPSYAIFCYAFGSPNFWMGGALYYCGNAVHPITFLIHGAFYADPDLSYCNYHILMGNSFGFMVQSNATLLAHDMAEARMRGMKVVVVDPVGTHAAAKANEWVPIRPGTDGALVLGMINLLVNELDCYDAEFLKKHTNGPYLVGPAGYYARDPKTGKPLIWDNSVSKAVPYDEVKPEDSSLTGTHQVGGVEVRPAFELLREHVRKYSPEMVAKVTTVPAEVVTRLAREFGEAAQIGSTILHQGKELPLRPACISWNKGTSQHKHGYLGGLACGLLNVIVGAVDVPGGLLGPLVVGPNGAFGPRVGPDGLLVAADQVSYADRPYPLPPVSRPEYADVRELFPVSPYTGPMLEDVMLSPENWQLDYKPEVLVLGLSNVMMSCSSRERMAEVLKRFDFVVYFGMQLNETAEMADVFLPLGEGLERLVPFHNSPGEFTPSGRGSSHYWCISQPVVTLNQNRNHSEVLLDLAERLDMRQDFIANWNAWWQLKGSFSLDPDKRYTWEEMVDISLRRFGPLAPDGLNSFKENAFVSLPKKVEEVYARPFLKARIPIYLEHFKYAGMEVDKVTREMGLDWDTSDYQPLPDWKPCPAFEENSREYELYLVNYKLPFHTFSHTLQNPWLDEIAEHHPWAYKVAINRMTAEKRGIKEGDEVCIEAAHGVKAKGKAHVTECIHPQVIGVAGSFGRWAGPSPIGKGKGIHFNDFVHTDLKHTDMLGVAVDCCVKVKVSRAEG